MEPGQKKGFCQILGDLRPAVFRPKFRHDHGADLPF